MADGTSTATADSGTTTDTATTDTATDATSTDTGVKLDPAQQAFVDQLVAKRLKESKERLDGEVEKRVAEQLKREKMDAAERAAAERDEARQQAEKATTESRLAVAEARVETALLAAGIKADRVDRIMRLVNVNVVATAEDQKKAARDAVTEVLADFPEFRPTPGASGGEMGGAAGGAGAGSVTLEQFKALDYDARVALRAKDQNLYRRLADQEQGA